MIWLSPPNYNSSFSRMQKFKDPMWCDPYHISSFSEEGVEKLGGACSLKIIDYSVSSRYNGSMELIFVPEAKA